MLMCIMVKPDLDFDMMSINREVVVRVVDDTDDSDSNVIVDC
jgi:hypothetical protein